MISIDRRKWLKRAGVLPLLPALLSRPGSPVRASVSDAGLLFRRCRPSDSSWPSASSWERLNQAVGGHLIKVQSPIAACEAAPDSASCKDFFGALKNPYHIGDQVGLTQSSGWVDTWVSAPSAYAVAVQSTEDVVAAVNFARDNKLRLVVKGGGHSYQGTSNAADSLLVWTRAMKNITLHDAFVGAGCAGRQVPRPAVTIGAGAIWMQFLHGYQSAWLPSSLLTSDRQERLCDTLFASSRHWQASLAGIAPLQQGIGRRSHGGAGCGQRYGVESGGAGCVRARYYRRRGPTGVPERSSP